MAGEAKTTTNHHTIKKWAEARGGKPVAVKLPQGDIGLLRIDFPGYSGADSLEEITWDAFFKQFDAKQLALLYQEETSSGEESRFFKLVRREGSDDKAPKSEEQQPKDEGKSSEKPRKADEKAPKTEDKTSEKPRKTESKPNEKAPKVEARGSEKPRKAESKPNEKARKSDEKARKATRK
ncbi:MAG TPA: hypothetical protein VGT82_00310 [Ktedonobacteraceae bacterium]|nr:hypothetical protein [Ktedonobacteraceae bacterium]